MDRHLDAYNALPPPIRESMMEDGVMVLDRWTTMLRNNGVPDAEASRAAMIAAMTALEMQMIFRSRRTG